MPQSPTSLNKVKISEAALRLAASKGWAHVTLDAVARAAKIPVAVLKKHVATPGDFVPLIGEEIDRVAFAGVAKLSGTPHDILFDLLMARFDVLQKHRQAILSMADAARHDRALSCRLARATMDGVYRMIDVARLDMSPRPLLALGLSAIYSWAFFAWRKDNSRDMAKTMAALDRALRLAGKAETLFKRRS